MKSKTILLRLTLILLVLLIVAGISVWDSYRLVPYVPVVLTIDRGDHVLRYDPSLLDPNHREGICKILDQYGEYYERRGDTILIRNHLFRDRDTLQNYTNKTEALMELLPPMSFERNWAF